MSQALPSPATPTASQLALLRDRRYWPIFITQFLGAFNDNLVKTMLVVLIAYGHWDTGGTDPKILVSLAAGLFILPFVLFCPLAGELTEKFSKDRIIRAIKLAEIGIITIAAAALFTQSSPAALLVIFLLGTHSAFFSPGKFSILPQHLGAAELIAANGLTSTGTYIAILCGTMAGALLAPAPAGIMIASLIMFSAALGGFVASLYIMPAPSNTPDLPLTFNPLRSLIRALRFACAQPHGVFPAMLGIAWFYFVAATFHAQFPNFSKETIRVDTNVLALFMFVFSLGIAAGGLMNNRLLRSEINAKLVPIACMAICLFAALLYVLSAPFSATGLAGINDFLWDPRGLVIIAVLFLLSFSGGIYVVPLRAIIQHRTADTQKGRIIAAGSLLDALLMLLSSLAAAALLSAGLAIEELFLLLSGLSAAAALIIKRSKGLYA